MWNKKKVGFLVFSTIFILGLIPIVFALLEPLYYLGSMDFVDLYLQNRGWLDPIVLTALFYLIFQTLVPRVFGGDDEESKHTSNKLAIILGIIAGLGVTFLARSYGPPEGPILGYAWIWIPFLLLFLAFSLFRYFKKDDKEELSIGTIIFIFAISLFLISLLAGDYIKRFPFLRDITSYGFILSGSVLAAALLLWFLFGVGKYLKGTGEFAKERWRESGKEAEEARKAMEKEEKEKEAEKGEEETIKHKPIKVIINVLPEKKTYSPGDEITLLARIEEKEGLISWKHVREDFACFWRINNIPQEDHNRDIRIQIPQLSAVEQQLFFSVEVQSIDHPERTAEADDYIVVRADIPKIMITDPVNTNKRRDLKVRIDQVLNFSYEISGAHPQEIEDVVWIFKKGLVSKTLTDSVNERDLASTKSIGKGSPSLSFESLGVEPGVYSIICAAVTKNGGYYRVELTKQIVADYFNITLEKKEAEEPPEPPTPPETEPKFYLNVLEGILSSPKKAYPLSKTNKDLSFSTEIGKYYMLQPIVENGDIKSYDIDITSDVKSDEKFVYNKQKRIGYYIPKTPGTKNINCVFKDPKKRIRKEKLNINIKINVKGTTPPEPGTGFIEIILPIKKNDSKANPYFIQYDTLTKFKAGRSPDINRIVWVIQAGHRNQPSFKDTDTALKLGEGIDLEYVFKEDMDKSIPGKHTIFVYGYKDNGDFAIDYIWVVLVPQPTPPPKANFLLNVFDRNKKGIASEKTDFSFTAYTDENYSFFPIVEGDDIKNYTVNLTADGRDPFRYDQKKNFGVILTKSLGKKRVTATFSKDKTILATITATIEVKPKVRSFITITEPITQEQSKKQPLTVGYGQPITLKADDVSADIDKVAWRSTPGYHNDPNRYVYPLNMGEGKEIKYSFEYKKGDMISPLGERTIFVIGYNSNKKPVVYDYIWINVISESKPKPEIKIIRINGENVKTGGTVNTPLGKPLTLEAEINDPALIDYFYWSVKEGSKPQEGLGREPTKGKNTNLFVYPQDYFKKYFENGKRYMVIVNGEKGEMFSKKGGSILKDEKGDPAIDYVYIQT